MPFKNHVSIKKLCYFMTYSATRIINEEQ